ncbi:hypothetical protein BH582_12155 [Vibrio sp. 10N.222.47.A9]|uniref:glycosyltransferase family 4 protein n=1 Tax=Vibrio sp. 10N.222.47.A9 TaxID=1903178 RepID=UPI0009763832|nr:glycosyltransferase family 4 protein [Vibrio sp. 10N.222.47.A9]OMO31694.1 hypothetical protein BH582_12155 [Vibrio sp. 10N.222.47.A9]
MNKIKVVIFINNILNQDRNSFTIGGVQTYLEELAKNLVHSGNYSCEIIQFSDSEFQVEVQSIKVIGTGKTDKKGVRGYIASNYDRASTIVIYGTDKFAFKLPNYVTINIQHGIAYDIEAFEGKRKIFNNLLLIPIYKFLQRFNARRIASIGDILCCVDYNYYNWIKTYGSHNENRISVIPNFSRVTNEEVPRNKRVIIARRFVERRGIGLIARVIDKYLAGGGTLEFTFAGDGEDKHIIEDLRDKYPGNISITRFHQTESQSVHSNFSFALVPSLGSEGTSLSLLEAMSVGCVVVASHVGGITNILVNEYNGFLIKPDESSYLDSLNYLESISDKDFKVISENAKSTVELGFSIKKWSRNWVELVKSAEKKL